jgi:3',5'-cyclic AMP phosphodiesterase CpdA
MSVVSLLQITDSHVVATEAADGAPPSLAEAVQTISGRTTTKALEKVLERITTVGFNPNLLVHTGDVVDTANAASYAVAARILERMGVPMLAVSGNHDEPHQLAAAFGETKTYECEQWLIVLVDSRIQGAECGMLGHDTLAWLDERLTSTDAHVLIGLHHPPLSVCGNPDCGLLDSHEMLDVLDRHPNVRGVISGHLHLADEIERREVRYLLSPSTCMQLRHRHPLPDNNRTPTRIGARVLELQADGHILSEIIWT